MPGTPLPPVTSSEVKGWEEYEPDTLSAYKTCLEFERKLATHTSGDKVRLVRLLGYLLLSAPSRTIRSEIADWIHSREPESDLADLGELFERRVIVAFKKYKARTPASTANSSRSSFEGTGSAMIAQIKEAPKNHASAKEQALVRENYRCIVSGIFHAKAPADVQAARDPNALAIYTGCAHIIPEATFFGVSPSETDNVQDYSASILAVLKRFCIDIDSFNGPKIHSLQNVMTMEHNFHGAFDQLELYLEATNVPHCYNIIAPPALKSFYKLDRVTFTTPDPEKLPLPSPELLSLHATCCKVAHLSGSAEYVDKVFRDAERIGVLSNDGASGDLLEYKLMSLSKAPVVKG